MFANRWLAAVAEPLARPVGYFLAFRAGQALVTLLREHGAESLDYAWWKNHWPETVKATDANINSYWPPFRPDKQNL